MRWVNFHFDSLYTHQQYVHSFYLYAIGSPFTVCVCFMWLAFVFSRTSHQQNDCVVESFLACQAFANSFASNYTFTNILYNLWILILLASLRADKLNLSSFVLAAILLCLLIFSLLFGMVVFWCVCVCESEWFLSRYVQWYRQCQLFQRAFIICPFLDWSGQALCAQTHSAFK